MTPEAKKIYDAAWAELENVALRHCRSLQQHQQARLPLPDQAASLLIAVAFAVAVKGGNPEALVQFVMQQLASLPGAHVGMMDMSEDKPQIILLPGADKLN